MAYVYPWSEVVPAGSAAANTIDTEIQNLRKAIRERMNVLVDDWSADPITPPWAFRCIVKRDADQSIADNVWDTVEWSGADTHDPMGMHDPAVVYAEGTGSRIIIPSGGDGDYLFGCTIVWGGDLSAAAWRQLRFVKNGAAGAVHDAINQVEDAAEPTSQTVVFPYETGVVATDYFYIDVKQNSGGALDLIAPRCQFWCLRISL